jgi:hypothetical protein
MGCVIGEPYVLGCDIYAPLPPVILRLFFFCLIPPSLLPVVGQLW